MAEELQLRAVLSLATAKLLAAEALKHGKMLHLPPLTVAVLDAGGHIITLDREDGASILRPKMAVGKAYAALSIGMSSRAIWALTETRATFVAALAHMSETFTPSAGGLLIEDDAKQVLGAIGVTGAQPDDDELCAIQSLEVHGFMKSIST